MIRFLKTHTGETMYDTNMMRETLKVSKSFLIKEMKKYNFLETDYVRYKNQILYTETSFFEFIEYLVKNRLVREIDELRREVDKMIINTDELWKIEVSQ